MEIVFLIGSIFATLVSVYCIGRINSSHSQLICLYKKSETLIYIHLMLGLVILSAFSMLLFGFNNTFWHLPYLWV